MNNVFAIFAAITLVYKPQSNHCNTKTQKATQSVIMIWIEILNSGQ